MNHEGTLPAAGLENNAVYDWIAGSTFTVAARWQSVQRIAPHLSALIRPGDKILDLCCGSGPMSFWFAEQGADVTGIDFATYMLAMAREEAKRRHASVKFVKADILSYQPGPKRYDVVSCFGSSITDFPLTDFSKMVTLVALALKPGGHFVLEYHDGSYDYIQGMVEREGIYQETPERITYRFDEYLPETGAFVKTIRNETRGEAYRRISYVYTVPVVQLIMNRALRPESHIVMAENHFLDIYVNR